MRRAKPPCIYKLYVYNFLGALDFCICLFSFEIFFKAEPTQMHSRFFPMLYAKQRYTACRNSNMLQSLTFSDCG